MGPGSFRVVMNNGGRFSARNSQSRTISRSKGLEGYLHHTLQCGSNVRISIDFVLKLSNVKTPHRSVPAKRNVCYTGLKLMYQRKHCTKHHRALQFVSCACKGQFDGDIFANLFLQA